MLSNKNITRKKFLHICGSVLAGGSIAGVSTVLIHRMYAKKDQQTLLCDRSEVKLTDCSGCAFDCPRKKNN